jgi:acyl-CoA dehydrogenase
MNDALQSFRSTVRQFLTREFAPLQARWREQRRPDANAWPAAGRAGILLPDVPQSFGGGGGTFARHAVVQEELAQAGVHFGTHNQSVVAHYILALGTEEQKRKWLPRMARGEEVGAIAMSEPTAGSDLQSIKTSARREGEYYVVNGTKAFVTNGLLASLLCLAVKTDPKASGPNGISLLIVETKNLPGYRIARDLEKVGRQAQDTCDIAFENMRVPVGNLLGPAEGKGFSQMMKQLPYERLSVAVNAVATMEQAVVITTKYVKERTAFGKPLIDFQNTRFKLAECKTESFIGRVFLDNCIQRFAAGELDPITAAMAKYWLTECQGRVIDECLQLHGGSGYLSENPIARLWTDSRVERIYAGTNEIMKEVIGWSL